MAPGEGEVTASWEGFGLGVVKMTARRIKIIKPAPMREPEAHRGRPLS